MLEALKEKVYQANLELVKQNLVIYTWGNVSAYDHDTGYVVIKPSGVDYDVMRAKDMVVVDLNGTVIEGDYNPSSDTPTHCVLYSKYPKLNAIVHTHSMWATIFSQAKIPVPVLGTTHADYFHGQIPCTRPLTDKEILKNYEYNTGLVIEETYRSINHTPHDIPGIIVAEHGPFSFGKTPEDAVHNAKVLEEVAKMAYYTVKLNPSIDTINPTLLDKHYLRKHGKNAYYGQKRK